MTVDRISDLVAPFLSGSELNTAQLAALRIYLDTLVKWNKRVNLTAIRKPDEIVTRHFGESLFAARQLFPEPLAASVIDIGSGAGFPGIPIKIWNDAADLILIESHQKKAVFLRELVRALALKSVKVDAARAEEISAMADVVTLRGVERFEQILLTACQLLRRGGRLALLIGEAQVQAAKDMLSDFHWHDPIRIPLSTNRTLLIGKRRVA
jgi:16S rRNA (guanine527-N7)-methyltransferase